MEVNSQLQDLAVLTPGKAASYGRLEDREGKLAGRYECMLEKGKLLFVTGDEPRFDGMQSSTVQSLHHLVISNYFSCKKMERCTYQRNNEKRSRNHYCIRKTKSVSYSQCVSVALII